MFRALLVTTVITTIPLSACGDGDGDDQASTAAATTTTDGSDSGASDGDVVATAAAATTTTLDGNLEAWCLAWTSPAPEVDQPITNEGLRTVFEATQLRHEAMLDVAPAGISAVNQSVVDFGRDLNAYLADNDWDPNTPRLEGSSAFETAQGELAQYAEDNC